MNEAEYVLLGMCLGGFMAIFWLNYQFSKGFERMKSHANILLLISSNLEYLGITKYSENVQIIANEIIKECE